MPPASNETLPKEDTLPWLSLNAAIELDNLRLKRQDTFIKVAALAHRLHADIDRAVRTALLGSDPESPSADPAAVARINAELESVSARLLAVAEAPEAADPDAVNTLRDYATNLSKLAAAEEHDKWQSHQPAPHPYRRLAAA